MGLDMYLSAEKYISGYDFNPEEQAIFKQIVGLAGMPLMEESKSLEVNLRVAYWRKANAIHNWFVVNVQDGKDECKKSYVDSEQLADLYQTVLKVQADHSLAPELLPTKQGFFFGSYEYDEWFFQDIDSTATQLAAIFEAEGLKGCDFYYRSSW